MRVFRFLCILFFLANPLFAITLPFEISRDPFQTFSFTSATQNSRSVVALPVVKLTGVVWDPQDPYAVILYKGMRRIVTRGDSLDTCQVLTISPKDVTLKYAGKTLVLKIGQEIKL